MGVDAISEVSAEFGPGCCFDPELVDAMVGSEARQGSGKLPCR